MFNLMDTVIRKKDRKWFRIVGHEDVFYELRPLGQSKTAGSTNDIDVHVKDLHKNYVKKDYPTVKVYNLADQEEKKEDEPMDYNEAVKELEGIQAKPSTPSVAVLKNETEPDYIPAGVTCEAAVMTFATEITKTYTVTREFLYRIDQILNAVGADASDSIMECTGRLIVQVIEEGIKEEK